MNRRVFSFFLTVVIMLTTAGGDLLQIYAQTDGAAMDLIEPDTVSDNDGSVSDDDGTVSGDDEPEETYDPTVSGMTVEFDEETRSLKLTITGCTDCNWMKVDVLDGDGKKVVSEECEPDVYMFDATTEGVTYKFRVTPYYVDEDGTILEAGTAKDSDEIYVPWKKAVLYQVDAEYNKETNFLTLSYEGENIKSVAVYEDGMENKITDIEDPVFRKAAKPRSYEVFSRHTFTFVPYNMDNKEGESKAVTIQIGDYEARITDFEAVYDEQAHKVSLAWNSAYTDFVTILCNDVELASVYKQNTYSFSYTLQPGGTYEFEIIPFNYNKTEGESYKEKLEYGYLDEIDLPAVDLTTVKMKDKKGNETGFFAPAVNVSWDAQQDAVYEIYRSKTGKKTEYTWYATVKAPKTDVYVYQDLNVEPGIYYYKIRRIVRADDYIAQEISTALSEENAVSTELGKTKVTAAQGAKGRIELTFEAKVDHITGYEVYKKTGKGKYEMIDVVTGNTYTDSDVAFGETYVYKVKPFYYQAAKKKTYYGNYSSVCKVTNTIGAVEAKVTLLSQTKAKLQWNGVSNAQGYEIYYRTDEPGDSYVLLKTTKKTKLTVKLKAGKTYYFQIKAIGSDKNKKNYFSQAELICRTGFSKPEDVKIAKTSHSWNAQTKKLTQTDKLSWRKVYGAKGYYVERYNEATGIFEQVAQIGKASTVTYSVSNPVTASVSENQTGILYRVTAFSGSKREASETITVRPLLPMPKSVTVKKAGSNVKVSWKAATAAESYRLYRSNGRGKVLVAETSGTSFTDKNVTQGVDVTYYVESVNKTMGFVSEQAASKMYRREFAKVANFKASAAANGVVKLKWKKTKNAKSYIIYCAKKGSSKYTKVAEVKGSATSYKHQNKGQKGVYQYKIASVQTNSAGLKVRSAWNKASAKGGR